MVEYRSRTTTHGRNMAGARALWRANGMTGDQISIDIPNRSISLDVSEGVLGKRRQAQEDRGSEAWTPVGKERQVSQALWAYAALITSASRGAVRDLSQLKK